MATDDERREAAGRLRAMAGRHLFTGLAVEEAIGTAGAGRDPNDAAESFARLAELVDPDCEEGRYAAARTARPVDRGALLELAGEMEGYAPHGSGRARKTVALARSEMGGFARRIREALGEG